MNHIHSLLKNSSVFVLATINNNLHLKSLLERAEREIIGHPDFEAFKRYNLALGENTDINVVDMDQLVGQAQAARFKVREAHQRHFVGGLNFLVLEKG